jgi:hypothetical protein
MGKYEPRNIKSNTTWSIPSAPTVIQTKNYKTRDSIKVTTTKPETTFSRVKLAFFCHLKFIPNHSPYQKPAKPIRPKKTGFDINSQ